MTAPRTIDGAQGEGGGQIVRSSLALALVTGTPVTIERIRAGRAKPGLRAQHLAAVNAAAAVCRGTIQGAAVGSSWLNFRPGHVQSGDYHFDVGTAGSATLVLQTVLPALLVADGPSTLVLEGGTHNPWAPPFDFLARAYLPLVARMGPRVTTTLERHGFYPAGGGRFRVTIESSRALVGFDLLERGGVRNAFARALVANLPSHIAEREVQTILEAMHWPSHRGRVEEVAAIGPGNVVSIEIESQHVTEIFTAFGRRGVRAERVAAEVVGQARAYLDSNAAVGPYLADQLLLPLGISAWQPGEPHRRRGGSFRTLAPSGHTLTHIEILRQFLDIDARVEPLTDGTFQIDLAGPSTHEPEAQAGASG